MKAILVIDEMPKKCVLCRFGALNGNCWIVGQYHGYRDERPTWCPLKPLPPKLDANDWHRMFSGVFSEREAKGYGWNACLKEITDE